MSHDNVRLAEVLSRLRDDIKERDPRNAVSICLFLPRFRSRPFRPVPSILLQAFPSLRASSRLCAPLPVGPGENLLRVENRNIRIVPPLQNLTSGWRWTRSAKLRIRRSIIR